MTEAKNPEDWVRAACAQVYYESGKSAAQEMSFREWGNAQTHCSSRQSIQNLSRHFPASPCMSSMLGTLTPLQATGHYCQGILSQHGGKPDLKPK